MKLHVITATLLELHVIIWGPPHETAETPHIDLCDRRLRADPPNQLTDTKPQGPNILDTLGEELMQIQVH